MGIRLPDDRRLQELLLPELRSRGLLYKGHLAEAGAIAEELLGDAWLAVEPQLKADSPAQYVERNLSMLYAGTPGGGTAWFSRLLSVMGKPCGHESVFRASGVLRAKRVLESAPWGECSGFASQWLGVVPDIRLVGLVRHPVNACNSMIGHLKWPPSRAIAYWMETHDRDWPMWVNVERCHSFVADVTGRPVEHVEHAGARTDPNAHEYDKALTWTDLPLAVRWVAMNRYGYDSGGIDK